jgi:DNA-binding CsgD family transcriptional regulator
MRHLKLIHLDTNRSNPSDTSGRMSMRHMSPADAEPTPRELEVEDLLCRGYSQENIAAIFGRSVNTISAHAMSLYRKRGVHTQVGLLLAYLERQGIYLFREEGQRADSNACASLEAAQ